MLFSQRYGYRSVKDVVQRESMDEDLRVGLWNVLDMFVWSRESGYWMSGRPTLTRLTRLLWHSYFKEPIDMIPDHWPGVVKFLRAYYFGCPWNNAYDFLEFIANQLEKEIPRLPDAFNVVLERESSAYRFVGGRIIEMTSSEEIDSVESALVATASIAGVGTHFRTALELLSDRNSPDYRNSIKESISAVEAIANHFAGTSDRSLGDAMRDMGLDVHGALNAAFRQLYGYTSDADGIRHALMDEPNLEFEDAKFMLVACSAFVNYLLAKASRQRPASS